MRRHLSAGIVAALAALATALPAYAAIPVLTVGGNPVAVGDILWGDLKSGTNAVFGSVNGNTAIKCTQSRFDATVTTNPMAPGVATASITSWTFGNCTINIFGGSIKSVTVNNLPYNLSISDAAGFPVTISPGTGGPIQITIVITAFGSNANCVYRTHNGANLSGNASNNGNTVTFTNLQFDKFSGPNICPSSLNFTAAYVLTDHTQSGGLVFVN